MVKRKNKNIVVLSLVGALLIGMIPVYHNAGAISKACQNSAACREAVEKEKTARQNAASAANSANAYQARVNELNAEIAGKEAEIVETQVEIDDLKKQIEKNKLSKRFI